MAGIIVAFSKADEGQNIRKLLMKNGYNVTCVCTSGAQVIAACDNLKSGVIVCGYKFADMIYADIWEETSDNFEMVMLVSPTMGYDTRIREISILHMPVKVKDLINSVEMQYVVSQRRMKKKKHKPKVRSSEDVELIKEAKRALMEVNYMTENEAHKYMQKKSMNNSDTLVETAKLILENLYRE